jgi:hypothetical protein
LTFDREKFKRLVHYIAWKAGKQPGFGATKLNKVLWFADARTYLLTGESITGATYIRQAHGPVPRQFLPIRHELEAEGTLRVIEPRGKFDHTKFIAVTPPDISALSQQHKQTVDYWINHIDQDHTASSISEETHDYPWEIAKMGEEIPLYAQLATRIRKPKGEELEWARKVAEKLKLP